MNYAIGSYGVSNYDGICSPVYVVMSHNPKVVTPEYVDLILSNSSYQKYAQSFGTGILDHRRAIGWDEIKKIPVAIPPIKEQVEIASHIRGKTARIDSLLEKKTRFIELLKEKRQAVITKAVTKGIDPSASMKDSGVDWIGKVPAHWQSKRFKHNLKLKTDKADTRTFAIALEHIESWSGRLIPNESEFDGDGTVFRKGDILFGKLRPYLAKVYLSETSGEAVGDIWVLRPIGENSPEFLQYQLLNREFITTVNASTTGAKMPRADWGYVGSLPAPTPPLTEQVSIAEFLKRATTRIDQLIEKTKASIELLNEHRAALITAAVTGKIDVRLSK
jgi:type I restriction enzyme S subunit